MNSQLTDLANNLTTSVASTGVTPLTGGLKGFVSGVVVAYAFDGDVTTGWGSDTAGQGYFKSANVEVVRITSAGMTIAGTLAFTGGFSGTVTTTGATASFVAFEGISTEAGSGEGPSFSSYRSSATPAANDFIGTFDLYGKDSAGNKTLYSRLLGQILDPTDTSEDSRLIIQIMVAGAITNSIIVTTTGTDFAGIVSASGGFKAAANPTATPGRVPTYQIFTSGTGATYTTPAGVTWIKVKVVGGGGGGGSGGITGGTGGTSSFNSVTAIGGLGGAAHTGPSSYGVGGAGGAGGSGTATLRIVGTSGGTGTIGIAATAGGTGGHGGNSPYFSGGGKADNAGSANTGGGGGGVSGSSGNAGDGGGGSGEYFELVIGAPAASYLYSVGAGGTVTSGTGTGAAGRIIVEEYYN